MGNFVAARRLRKSILNDNSSDINLGNIGIIDIEMNRKFHYHQKEKNINEEGIYDRKKISFKFKNKIFIKFFIAINLVFVCLVCKLIFKEQVLNNKYAKIIIKEYSKDYSKTEGLEKIEECSKKCYELGKYIIPGNIANYISSNYIIKVKPQLINFNIKEEVISVFNNINKQQKDQEILVEEEKVSEEIKNNDNTGVGGGEPYAEASLEEIISAVSIMDNDVNQILSKKINVIIPVKGTITSRYGARDLVFDNVNPYHTGIDIANSNNTKISSATDGVVIKTEKMNKYYGNNIEIEKDGVIFKYAHLNKIEVKQGDLVKQGDVIGLMGSTGMSTGPHLHFEIKINNRTIDPEKILKFT